MGKLQEEFSSHLNEAFRTKLDLAIHDQLSNSKIKFTKKQITKFKRAIFDDAQSDFDFGFTDSQVRKSGFASKSDFENALNKELAAIMRKGKEIVSKLGKTLPEVTQKLSVTLAGVVASGLEKTKSDVFKEQAEYFRQFNSEILNKYGESFDLIESMIILSIEAGERVANEEQTTQKSGKLRLDVLFKLHARSCQIASESLILLRNGYPDGAIARWRTMYEILVVSLFLASEPLDLTRRYLAHEAIEDYKSALLYQEHAERTQSQPIPKRKMASLENKYEKLKRKYGKEFATEYGWACKAIDNSRPNFSQIESKIDLSYVRPYYKIASYNVHASPHGIKHRLGIPSEERHIMLAGPSQYGLSMPTQFIGLTLTQITANLILLRPSMDSLVMTNVLRGFQENLDKKLENLPPW